MTEPGPLAARIAAELRAELARQDRSKRWLAEQVGHSHVTVTRWLKDGHMPIEALIELCDALGLSLPDLWLRVERRRGEDPDAPRRRRADALRPTGSRAA